MAVYNWTELLHQWSRDILSSKAYRERLSPDVIGSGWLGFSGATEADILRSEARLHTKLPPSYREFLKVSNGWRMTTPFIDRLWSTAEIEWFSDRRKDWIDAWDKFVHYYGEPESVPDDQYFVYGEGQTPYMRANHFKATLEISDVGDSAIYLLNPLVVSPEGEWEAWFYANWNPGAERYRSFWELMLAEYESCLRLKDV